MYFNEFFLIFNFFFFGGWGGEELISFGGDMKVSFDKTLAASSFSAVLLSECRSNVIPP